MNTLPTRRDAGGHLDPSNARRSHISTTHGIVTHQDFRPPGLAHMRECKRLCRLGHNRISVSFKNGSTPSVGTFAGCRVSIDKNGRRIAYILVRTEFEFESVQSCVAAEVEKIS